MRDAKEIPAQLFEGKRSLELGLLGNCRLQGTLPESLADLEALQQLELLASG